MNELQSILNDILNRTDDLKAILVTDKFGVIIAKATTPDLPPQTLEPAFAATFGVASDQCSKLGLSRTNTILSTYDRFKLLQMNCGAVVLTLVGGTSVADGTLFAVGNDAEAAAKIVVEGVGMIAGDSSKKDVQF